MQELHWNLGWTLAVVAICWVALSSLVAFGLGQVIKRGKAPAQPVKQGDGPTSAYADVAPSDDELLDLEASRARSGTRLKPVRFEEEAETELEDRKVS